MAPVDAEALPRLMKAVEGGVRQLVILSTHGVDRTDKLPFNLQNMMGALDKQRASEQVLLTMVLLTMVLLTMMGALDKQRASEQVLLTMVLLTMMGALDKQRAFEQEASHTHTHLLTAHCTLGTDPARCSLLAARCSLVISRAAAPPRTDLVISRAAAPPRTDQEVILRAKRGIPSYSVVRIGKLKGSGSHACQIAPGDALSGDMTAEATADVLLETLQRPEAVHASARTEP